MALHDLREGVPLLKNYSSHSDSEKDEKRLSPRRYEPLPQQRRQLLEQQTALEQQQAQLVQQVNRLEQQLGDHGNQLREQGNQIYRLTRYSLCGVKLGWVLVVCFAVLAVAGSLGLSGYQQYELMRQQSNINAIYERIGARHCPENIPGTIEVYSGIAVGFVTETGSTAFQCMPDNSMYVKYYNNSIFDDMGVPFAHTAKYETFIKEKNGTHVACAKCSVEGRSSVELLPSTHTCQSSWTREYSGYLMTDRGPTGFVCVDRNMEPVDDDHNMHNPTLHHVAVRLSYDGYQTDKVLSCVVCSK